MRKYRLMVINPADNSEHIINVYNQETHKYEASVHIKDIDHLTSKYLDSSDFIADLHAQGMINFTKGRTYIVSRYKDDNLHFKTIYHSKLIETCSKNVKEGFIQVGANDAYYPFYSEFMKKIKTDSNFIKAIETTKYMNATVRMLFLKYYLTLSQNINTEELEEQQRLKVSIEQEFKRYKTFRGLYIFMNEYNQYGYKPPKIDKPKNLPKSSRRRMKSYEETHPINRMADVEAYNQKYDEYLSEDEYAAAYGDSETHEKEETKPYMKKKGVHNDKYTK